MKQEIIDYFIIIHHTEINWSAVTYFDDEPSTYSIIESLIEFFGIEGIDNFLDYGYKNKFDMTIIISDSNVSVASTQFNFHELIPANSTPDIIFTAFEERLSVCLQEFFELKKESDGNEEKIA